jgi:hypothetical protein
VIVPSPVRKNREPNLISKNPMRVMRTRVGYMF